MNPEAAEGKAGGVNCDFSKNVSSEERVKLLFFVT